MDSFIRDVDNLAFIFIPFQVIFKMNFFGNSETLGKSLEKNLFCLKKRKKVLMKEANSTQTKSRASFKIAIKMNL